MSILSGNGLRTVLIVSVLLFSLILRLRGLTARSLWFDEASAWAAVMQFSPMELLDSCRQNVHPPVWYFAFKAWVCLFGDSLGSMRGLSVLMGVAVVGCGMGLAAELARDLRRVHGRFEAAMMAGLLLATSPMQILWSQQARMYMLGSLLTVCSSWLLLIAIRRQRWRDWSAFGVAALVLLHTHNFGMFIVAGQGVYVLGTSLADRWRLRNEQRKHGSIAGATREEPALALTTSSRQWRGIWILVIVGICFLPWLRVVGQQMARVRADYWIEPFEIQQIGDVAGQLFLPENAARIDAVLPQRFEWFIVAAIFNLLFAAIALRLATLPAVVAAVSFGGGVIVSACVTPLMVARYFQFGQVVLLVAMAVAVCRIPQRRLRMSIIAAIVTLPVVILGLLPSKSDFENSPGLCGMVQSVLSKRRNEEPVLVVSSYLFHATRYHVEHSAGSGAVRVMLLRDTRQLRHYSGGPVIQPTDILLPTELDESDFSSAWLMDVAAFPLWMEEITVSPDWDRDEDSQLRANELSGVRCVVTAVRITRKE